MFIQLFSKYLLEHNLITKDLCDELMSEMMGTRVKMGTIAVAEGLLTEIKANEINHLQTQLDKRFGDIAVSLNYLTTEQVEYILSKQGNESMKFYQLLNEKAGMDMGAIDEYLLDFKKTSGFTDEELEAVKNDDFDKVISLYATVRDKKITDIASLVMRNLVRFVTRDFYIGRMKKVQDYSYDILAGQKLKGSNDMYLGFATSGQLDGMVELAKGYANGVSINGSEEVYDAICEFSNLNNGLLASEYSNNGEFMDMLPPCVYINQKCTGTAYVMPLYIKGCEVEIVIANDTDFLPGDKPHDIKIKKSELKSGNSAPKGAKKVLVVDDSSLIRKMLIEILERNGYIVQAEATNGAEAVELYESLKPDIVTLDVTMPVMDGVEALKKIIEKDKNARVVMVTAAGQQERLMEALKIGAKKFVTKPFDEVDLVKNLES